MQFSGADFSSYQYSEARSGTAKFAKNLLRWKVERQFDRKDSADSSGAVSALEKKLMSSKTKNEASVTNNNLQVQSSDEEIQKLNSHQMELREKGTFGSSPYHDFNAR